MTKLLIGIIILLMFIGCSGITKREKSALVGAGAGAIIGQAVGGDSKGALIGATVGAIGGAAISNYDETGNILGKED